MKKLVIVFALLQAVALAFGKNDWTGRVVDEKGEPLAYATVAVLSSVDSTVVCGALTEEDGTFNIITEYNDGFMEVSMLGYKTMSLTPSNGAVITLTEDVTMLQNASVTAMMPKTKLTSEGIQTNIRGSVLESAGTANDVLSKTSGIIKTRDGLEVIGKGSPLVYINGRKVSDSSELDRLQSYEIQSIEVITNPGAQYDATVRSVVRIRTIRRQGDGFGFNLVASDAQSLQWKKGYEPSGAINVNYRTGGVDIFTGANYSRSTYRQISNIKKTTYGKDNTIENKGDLICENDGQVIHTNAGVNWQIADNHFIGGKVEWGRHIDYNILTVVNDNVFENGTPTDQLTSNAKDKIGANVPYTLGANLYYNGIINNKLGIDVNLDYYGTDDSTDSNTDESSSMTADRSIHAVSNNNARLYAAKAVLSYPAWKGQFQAGTEETFTRRSDEYSIAGADIKASSSDVKEDTYAWFASYAFYLPRLGQLSAGIRYEHVRYSYQDAVSPEYDLTRNYGNWFPNISLSTAFGPVQVMLNYSAKTVRPKYALLSSAIRYNSRYLLQSGYARLQPELSHNISAAAIWKFITFAVDYTHTGNAIMTWSSPFNDEGVVLVQPRNVDTPYRRMTTYINITPTVGIWTINYTVGAMPQWLTINAPDQREADGIRVTRFNNKPIFFAQLFNTFTLKDGWQIELGTSIQSKGYTKNLHIQNVSCDVTAAVQKTLLKDKSLVLRLEGTDLADLSRYDVDSDFGSHIINQTNRFATQKVKISLRYSFNKAQSKYRGTGAGQANKNRM